MYKSGYIQGLNQLLAVGETLVVAIGSGYFTGSIMSTTASKGADEYEDGVWWEGPYFEVEAHEA